MRLSDTKKGAHTCRCCWSLEDEPVAMWIQFTEVIHVGEAKTRRRMARERRGAGSSLVSIETQNYKQYIKDVL